MTRTPKEAGLLGPASPALLAAIALCLLLSGVDGNAVSRQEQQIFRSGANAVSVDATVRDKNRRSMVGLTARDFEVSDNGVAQEVADVSYGRLPIDVTIALDVSTSVDGLMLERLRRGVLQLMKDLGREDRLKLVLFNSQIARAVDFTTNVTEVEAAIKKAKAGGGTSLLDSIGVTLVAATAPDRRQLLVVFTDGSDSTSITTPEELTTTAIRSRATIAFVVPGSTPVTIRTPSSVNATAVLSTLSFVSPPRPLNSLFNTLATTTGGSVVLAAANADLSAIFKRILDEFRSAYVLLYNARGVDRGGYHTIEVKVKREGVTVVARRGYWY